MVHVTGIELDKSSVALAKDTSVKLIASITPPDASDLSVYWSSSESTIATVDSNGIVT